MTYELVLISVVMAGGYWGQFFVRTRPHGTATFGLMLLAAAVLSALGLAGGEYDIPVLSYAGAIGVGIGTCVLAVGPILRSIARRFAAAERLAIAQRLLSIVDVLAPGSGVAEERALLGAMGEIRDGRIDPTLDALESAKSRLPPEARLAIDERIAMLYLAAYRWTDAIAHAEKNLFGAAATADPASLRGSLGVAPPVWIELLGAFGRTGDLDRAAEMLARLEDACLDRADAGYFLHRGRMMFLALAGRAPAVRELVVPANSRHMSRGARAYWIAVAHEHAGERAEATTAYQRARSHSRGRPRAMIDEALARLAEAKPVVISDAARAVISRVEAAPTPVLPRVRLRGPWATWTTTAAILAVAAAISIFLGPTSDLGVLMRGGAMVRGFVHHGEWWRLVACVFIHVGGVHLAVNAIGLWFLGRLAEDLFGGARTIAIFAASGVAGAVASYAASPAGVSAGASGAIFGLLGAVLVELTLHRAKHRQAWKRGMWGSVVVVTVAQVGVGFMYPVIDQWAHGAGLAAGALAGAALSPSLRFTRLTTYASRAIAVAFGIAAVVAGIQVTRTPIAKSLAAEPMIRHRIGVLTIEAPADWQLRDGGIGDPDGIVIVTLDREARASGSPPNLVALWAADEPKHAKQRGFDEIAAAPDLLIPLPPPWECSELDVSFEDPMGYRQRYRAISCGQRTAEGAILASVYAPTSVVRAAPRYIAARLASVVVDPLIR